MADDPRVTALQNALAALDAAIAQTRFTLARATDPDDIRSLNSALADLSAEHARIQAQLDNLQAASFGLDDEPRALSRRTVASVLRMAKAVKHHAATVSKSVGTPL